MHPGLIALGIYLLIGVLIYLAFKSEEIDPYEISIIPFWPLLLIIWWLVGNSKSKETDCGCS